MAASEALHPIQFGDSADQFQHHERTAGAPSLPPTAAVSQSHPELTDGSGFNAAKMWSYQASASAASSPPNQD